MEKERYSNIELLRIVAALGIIVIHIGDGRMNTLELWSANQTVMCLIESFAHCCVNIYILITGYFLAKSDRRFWGKPIDLLIQVFLVQFAMFLVYVLANSLELTIRNFALYCTPNNYFVILFITLYILSPYLNKILRGFSSYEWKVYVIIVMSVFSCYAVFVDFYGEIMGKEWFGLSPIGAWGNQQGFTIVNFIILYSLGAYLRCNNLMNKLSLKKALLIFIGCIIVCFLWAELNCTLPMHGLRSAWVYHNPFIILMAVSIFVVFSKLNIKNKIVNNLAKAAFMCYIVHTQILGLIKWDDYFQGNVFVLLLIMLSFCIAVYLISWIIYKLYTIISQPLLEKLNKKEIIYFGK